ncbi:MAG: hypothetical protein KC416_11720 [Myxococcales bacterium]|nr:hypothetical protein [Myxococcales bacterium]
MARLLFRSAVALGVLGLWLIPGRAPATVEEQRARLPPPAHCEDPVTGVWKAHKYDPRYRDWYIFTLTIRRVPGEKSATDLEGTINSHFWNGDNKQSEPPPCGIGVRHVSVHMEGQGRITDDGEVQFWGTSWRPENAFCGPPIRRGEYNLDHFSGRIDPKIQEFQSVNNDGGRSVNDPMVFRRVACDQPPPAPHVNPVAPPFEPPQVGGCGCRAH